MTSEEIKSAKQQLIDNPDIDVRVAQGAALYEIAYQLAVANEFEKHFRCIRCYRRIEHVDQLCDKAVAMACKGIA